MDQAVLAAYGWSDVLQLGPCSSPCGFGLDDLDTEADAQLPDDLQERIASGDLFFWDAGEGLDFQGQLQACGAISGRRKLPWRHHWPDAVRDDVLARLLALNAERYAQEVALGLHSKAAKQAAKASQTPPGHSLHLPLPAPSPSITKPQPIHYGTAQEQARSVNPRRLGLSVLYHNERCYTDPPKTPGPCEAIPKTFTTTGFWPRCQPGSPALCCPNSPGRVFMRIRLFSVRQCTVTYQSRPE